MIGRVYATGFKGRGFSVEIGPKTIIVGNNGAGKSAVVQALQLALEGQVPGVHKTSQAIMDAFGSTERPMYVEARTSGAVKFSLGRQFSRDAKGTVSQTPMVDRKKSRQVEWMEAYVAAGSIKVFAVDEFLSMSSRAMIARMAEKFGGERLDDLGERIDRCREKLLKRQADLRENEAYVSRTAQGIAELNLPPGTVAQVTDEIERVSAELQAADDELASARKQERRRIREQELADKAAAKAVDAPAPPEPAPAPPVKSDANVPPRTPAALAAEKRLMDRAAQQHQSHRESPADGFRRIINAIEAVNCPGCRGGGAVTVAKVEMMKWEKRR